MAFDGERFVTGLIGDVSSGDIQSEHYHRYLFALQFCEERDVLDIASGEGYGSFCLGQVARSVVGVDASAEAVDFANRNYLNDRVSFKHGTAQSIPIENASIDVVVCFETLGHFNEHEAFASELKRVLRPAGLLVISSPNRAVHLRQLDRGGFLDYVSDGFVNVRLFAQRPLAGSVIATDDTGGENHWEGFILRGEGIFHRTDGVPHPPCFIAVASDAPLPPMRSSVLQNPALLLHVDAQRHAATDAMQATEAARRADQAAAADAAAQAARQVADLQHELERARAGLLAEQQRVLDLAAQSAGRIKTIRAELSASRRRNIELAGEKAGEIDGLRHRLDHVLLQLDLLKGSTAWKMTWPIRQLGMKIPSGVRRVVRSGVSRSWWSAILQRRGTVFADQSPPPIRAASPPVLLPDPVPADLQRQQNPGWLEPSERPAFIRLRSMRPRAKIAVVMHVYYTELWAEMAEAVGNIPEEFDLFVTLVVGASEGLKATIEDQFPSAHVLLMDNHGRDILPFLALIRTGVLFGYEVVCKLHSKRSTYLDGGDTWRHSLIGGMLGSVELAERILAAFRADADLGMVVAPGHMFSGREFWMSNEARCSQLFRAIGLNEAAFERSFAGGSMYWIRPFILRTIDALRLGYDDFEPEPIATDGCTVHSVERIVSLVCYDAGMRIVDSANVAAAAKAPASTSAKVHVIANYLPRFHPVPENDAWRGKGFTEWTSVTTASPLFMGHRQPRLPTDLGFYDLRLPEIRHTQAELARQYGVTAFSYYYYWFNGRKLLNLPIEQVAASGEPDFPFMLCWANEPWTRNCDGPSGEVLFSQDYAPGWERSFAADVAQLMRDPRYLRLNGKPLLALYCVGHFPDKIDTIKRLREAFASEGFPHIQLIAGWINIGNDKPLPAEPTDLGLDAYFECPPHGIASQKLEIPAADRAPGFAAHIYDYGATVDAVLDQLAAGQTGFRYRGVMMGWDNTARRGPRSCAFHGATPANFRRWLRAALRTARLEASGPETAVFVNAWNEWAEGTYLEPDRDFGSGWLEAVASAATEA